MINTSNFHVTSAQKVMSADASDIFGMFKVRVEGAKTLAIESHKTRKITNWMLFNVVFDRDGDIMCWQYKPTANTIIQMPILYDWILEIFND